ncbi:MAG: helix-turn-helix transcriptional regulator [Thermoleophilia bacterium]|nr:helix-turn-helix transcriptional regulator [Thermoleophilia bacterium]
MRVDPEIARIFGANLLYCRKRAGVSQEELGFLSNLHRTEIGMLERGIRLARIDTLIKLAGSLEVEPGDLLDGLEWTPGSLPRGSFRIAKANAPEEIALSRRVTFSAGRCTCPLLRWLAFASLAPLRGIFGSVYASEAGGKYSSSGGNFFSGNLGDTPIPAVLPATKAQRPPAVNPY